MNDSAIKKLKDGTVLDLTQEEKLWLIQQAEKAKEYEEWLRKIADMNPNETTAVDASYWALLALGEV